MEEKDPKTEHLLDQKSPDELGFSIIDSKCKIQTYVPLDHKRKETFLQKLLKYKKALILSLLFVGAVSLIVVLAVTLRK
jgi:hypothetical protein